MFSTELLSGHSYVYFGGEKIPTFWYLVKLLLVIFSFNSFCFFLQFSYFDDTLVSFNMFRHIQIIFLIQDTYTTGVLMARIVTIQPEFQVPILIK